jgi:hypothetical protein
MLPTPESTISTPARVTRAKAQVAPRQHAQLEERQRLGPFVVHEQHQQQQATAEQPADQRRIEPAPAVAQRQAQHDAADGRQAEQHAAPVELLEALQAQRVLRQAPADAGDGQQRGQDDLPERPLPADVLGPQARQRRAQVGAEGGGQGVAGQAVDLDARRQEAQRHAHQHRWQGTGGEALHNAQQHQAVQVGGEGLQQAKHGEQADGAHGEAAQREGGGQPRREGHGRHRGGAVHRQQPGAFVGTDAHGATDVAREILVTASLSPAHSTASNTPNSPTTTCRPNAVCAGAAGAGAAASAAEGAVRELME